MEKITVHTSFDPEKHGMMVCRNCNGIGYIQNPKRQCCPKCGGFGLIKKEKEAFEMNGGGWIAHEYRKT